MSKHTVARDTEIKGLKLLSQNGYGPLGQEPPETSESFMPSGLKLSVWTNNHV